MEEIFGENTDRTNLCWNGSFVQFVSHQSIAFLHFDVVSSIEESFFFCRKIFQSKEKRQQRTNNGYQSSHLVFSFSLIGQLLLFQHRTFLSRHDEYFSSREDGHFLPSRDFCQDLKRTEIDGTTAEKEEILSKWDWEMLISPLTLRRRFANCFSREGRQSTEGIGEKRTKWTFLWWPLPFSTHLPLLFLKLLLIFEPISLHGHFLLL